MAEAIAIMQRKAGATITEIMSALGWQRHTVRGFVAGAMKKARYAVGSFKPEGGERTYRLNKEEWPSPKGPIAMTNIDIIDALNQLAAVPAAQLRQLLNCAGPLRARALLVAANVRQPVLQENPES
jgi:predicted transcriptional regulator